MEVSGQLHAPAFYEQGKSSGYSQEAEWAPDPVWTRWRNRKPFPYHAGSRNVYTHKDL